MHRHGYKGRKLGRETDQRRALMRGLTKSLIEHGRIETTVPKAKDLRSIAEKLITKARKGGLLNRRLIIAGLGGDVHIANMLVDQVAPQLKRDSGYLRIERTRLRVGDGAEMAIIEFVDKIDYELNKEKPAPKKADKIPAKKPAVKKTEEKK